MLSARGNIANVIPISITIISKTKHHVKKKIRINLTIIIYPLTYRHDHIPLSLG